MAELTHRDKNSIYLNFLEVADGEKAVSIDMMDHYIYADDEMDDSFEESIDNAFEQTLDYLDQRGFDEDEVSQSFGEIKVLAAIAFTDNVGVLLEEPDDETGDSGGYYDA